MKDDSKKAIAINSSIANIDGKVIINPSVVMRKQEVKFYRVFVSGTYTDLFNERQSIIQVLLEHSYMPESMEFWSCLPKSEEGKWKIIRQYIDTCDYYVLIMNLRVQSSNASSCSW
jgi:hypothetical protein